MRKVLFALLILLAHATSSMATVTFTLLTSNCDTTNKLKISYAGSPGTMYQMNWSGGIGASGYAHHVQHVTNDTIFNYGGGYCHVEVRDSSYVLVDSGSYYGALPMDFTFSPTAPFCSSTTLASVTASGGTPPYIYTWTQFSSTVLGTSSTVSLPSGVYRVWIVDAAGCMTGSSLKWIPDAWGHHQYVDSIHAAPTFSVATTSTDASCTNGTASVSTITGSGVAPYTYSWSTGATTASISGLMMGGYSLAVTDAVGCVNHATTWVSQSISIPVTVTPTPATCTASDGAAIAFGSGGVSPYTYHWSNGATTQSQTGLPAGYLTVTATDANGCIGTGYVYINATTPITVTYSTTPSVCTSATGSATLAIAGGTAPYTVTWTTFPVQTGITATSLAPGNYPFHIVDAVGCVQNGVVVVPPIHIIATSFSTTAPHCALADGAISVSASGGSAPYTYAWTTGATTPGLAGVTGGWYHVTVTDAAGCSTTVSNLLAPSNPLIVNAGTTPSSCLFNADGSITAIASLGTPPYTYAWIGTPTATSGAIASGLLSRDYTVCATDAIGCTAYRYVYLDYNHNDSSCYCTIRGYVYHDVNSNCVQESTEPGVNHMQLYCSGRGYSYTDNNGYYEFKVPAGTYTVSETIQAFYPLSPCQVNSITVTSTPAAGCSIPLNFANVINPIHDIHVCTWDYDFAVPGNLYHTITVISNQGTVTEPAILASHKPDGQLLAPLFVPGSLYAGSPYYYNTPIFPSLAPGTAQPVYKNFNVPTDIPLGTVVTMKDTAVYAAPMTNWLTDYTPWNNLTYFTTTVVASFDPNFKEVYPKGVGPSGVIQYSDSILEYMVHFQNTGSWYAQNIVVLDTIDNNLDWTTLKPIYESAPCKISVTQSGSYKIARFEFNNIYLPPQSFDDLRSSGMFTYTIKTKNGLPVGSQFFNRASIYFDYNAPILTNRTENTLVSAEGVNNGPVANVTANSFMLYPNPANNTFNTVINSETDGNASMLVADVTGKTLITKTITLVKGTQTIATDASQLAPGVYLVSLNHDGKTETQKLVIMK